MNHDKIAPGLQVVLENFQRQGEPGLLPNMRTMGIVPGTGSAKPTRTVVFLDCDLQADLSHLAQQDIRVNQKQGRFRTAILPFSGLDALSQESQVNRIIPSRYLRPKLDLAGTITNVTQWRKQAEIGGKGVIVGIIDTGIDSEHPAFAHRILRVWDQVLPGPGVEEGRYGAEFAPAMLSVSRDEQGHGTHVAGIAAGADAIFSGVAPEADFVIVKTTFNNAHIADAVRYIFRIARELNRPAVINMSLGGHFDAHDGSDPLSQIINEESGPGRIVCCAAGNEGNDDIHAQVDIAPGAMQEIRLRVPGGSVSNITLNGWYSGNNTLEIGLVSPLGATTGMQPVIHNGSSARQYQMPNARAVISTPPPNLANGDHQFVIDLQDQKGDFLAAGLWKLRVQNTGKTGAVLDAWVMDDAVGNAVNFTGSAVQDEMKIGAPGSAAAAVTVASYTTRVEWQDIDQRVQSVGLELNAISDFSSEGPLRGGAQKPDVSAPGAMIISCLSRDSQVERRNVFNESYRVMAGTSMATPFITGMVTLLLQQDPRLDPAAIKSILRQNSKIPENQELGFDTKWGRGLINAVQLLQPSGVALTGSEGAS